MPASLLLVLLNGVWLLLPAPLARPLRGALIPAEAPVSFFGALFGKLLLSNSLPSTLQLNLSFHSSPASESYRSCMDEASKVRESFVFDGCELKKSWNGLLPPAAMRASSEPLKASMVMLRMKDMWTPRPRCTPEQERHMKMPSLGEAW
jgi:hypothetical protein